MVVAIVVVAVTVSIDAVVLIVKVAVAIVVKLVVAEMCSVLWAKQTRNPATPNRLEAKCSKPMADPSPNPKLESCGASARCHVIRAPQRDSWPWSEDPNKVLVLLITWLGAKERHILKYSDLYTKQGLDVLVVKSKAKDFIWPRNSIALAEQIYTVLETEMQDYDHIISHTMSVGSFNWTVLRMHMKEKEHADRICSKFRGQILDSVVAGVGKGGVLDETPAKGQQEIHALDRMVHGIVVAKKLNPVMQRMTELVCKAYFFMTKKRTVKFYEDALKFFREEPLKVPTLFLSSRDDPMCDSFVLEKLVDIWREKNVYVSIHVWDSSPHAQHYIHHKNAYESLHEDLFKEIFSSAAS
ncbi:transmembrane protein 53 [Elysia marginata]|uniref:Transmembrane protein 53 n=1 Tax=Elysia marginata TaxID=1093978 RepID=A0AAV4G010_9GAST|nr:transmembrane protein 53 [Elysia marginata]